MVSPPTKQEDQRSWLEVLLPRKISDALGAHAMPVVKPEMEFREKPPGETKGNERLEENLSLSLSGSGKIVHIRPLPCTNIREAHRSDCRNSEPYTLLPDPA